VPEFTIEIESHEGTTTSEDVLDRLSELLVKDEFVLGPSSSLNTKVGRIGSIFQVEADSFEQATQIGVERFTQALLEALADETGERPSGEASIDKVLVERVAKREPALT
jgi:hypothetical protein